MASKISGLTTTAFVAADVVPKYDGTATTKASTGTQIAEFLEDHFRAGCELTNTTDQDIASTSTWTTLTWDTETFDDQAFHDGVNPTRITVPTGLAGRYAVIGQVLWVEGTSGATNIVQWRLQINGAGNHWATPEKHINNATIMHGMQVLALLNLAAADFVELQVWQDIAAGRDVALESHFGAYLLGKL